MKIHLPLISYIRSVWQFDDVHIKHNINVLYIKIIPSVKVLYEAKEIFVMTHFVDVKIAVI